jgi:cell division protein FtsB
MHEKLKHYQEKAETYLDQLHDVRVIGLLSFAVMILLISWSGVKAIDTNYKLQKQISTLDQQNAVQELANNNLSLTTQYYKSNQYLELTARQNFGLAQPGETELIVPAGVALAHTITITNTQETQAAQTKAQQPAYQRHFQSWINFFLHRQSTEN